MQQDPVAGPDTEYRSLGLDGVAHGYGPPVRRRFYQRLRKADFHAIEVGGHLEPHFPPGGVSFADDRELDQPLRFAPDLFQPRFTGAQPGRNDVFDGETAGEAGTEQFGSIPVRSQ